MISDKFAKEQVLRLSRLRNFPNRPDEAPLRADLIAELRQCSSEDHARSLIDGWLAESEDSPTVSQLRAIVRRERPAKQIGCERCNFTGYRLAAGRRTGNIYAVPCQCRPVEREAFLHA